MTDGFGIRLAQRPQVGAHRAVEQRYVGVLRDRRQAGRVGIGPARTPLTVGGSSLGPGPARSAELPVAACSRVARVACGPRPARRVVAGESSGATTARLARASPTRGCGPTATGAGCPGLPRVIPRPRSSAGSAAVAASGPRVPGCTTGVAPSAPWATGRATGVAASGPGVLRCATGVAAGDPRASGCPTGLGTAAAGGVGAETPLAPGRPGRLAAGLAVASLRTSPIATAFGSRHRRLT